MNFKKGYISASLVIYLIKLGEIIDDDTKVINDNKHFSLKEYIEKSLHDEFSFVIKNIFPKHFSKNTEWKNFISELKLETTVEGEKFASYFNNFIMLILLPKYKLYETRGLANEYISVRPYWGEQ